MKKRKILITAATYFTAVIGLWMLGAFDLGTGDAARHRAWRRTGQTWFFLRSVNKKLPAGLVRLTHLSQLEEKYGEKWDTQREALVASGYFTNTVIAIPRAEEAADTPAYYQHQRAIIRKSTDQIRKALQGRGEFQCSWPSNGAVMITCRPQDVPLCAKALQD